MVEGEDAFGRNRVITRGTEMGHEMDSSQAPELYLDWLDLAAAPGFAGVGGRFGMTILPGRRCSGVTAKHPRDLDRDAATLAALGLDAFVLLVEDHELTACGVPTFSTTLGDQGIPVIRCPIVDHGTPGDVAAFATVLREVDSRLRAGQTLGVSCHGGLGRTGTLAACLLKDAGLDADAAIAAVRRSRPGAIETVEQEAFVRDW